MNIIEAIRKANTGQGIRRKNWKDVCIVPTDTENCCELYVNNHFRSRRWNPIRQDLIATDWQLTAENHSSDRILPKIYDPGQLIH